jgi:acetyl-CoA acyltransferase
MNEAVIVDAVRTASGRGKAGGALSGTHPAFLLASVITALLERHGLDGAVVEDVIAGCVGQAGDQATNIARTATLLAGLPESVPATTVDRQCGSSQQAVHFAAQAVMAGVQDVVIACGVESMSRVPMGTAAGGGDPLEPLVGRWPGGLVNQGVAAELVAARWQLGRAELDEYAARSHALAGASIAAGAFVREVVPIIVPGPNGLRTHAVDETLRPGTTVEGLAGLRPSFRTDELAARFPEIEWQITAGNSSPLTDGASAALIMSAARVRELGLTARARFRAMSVIGSDPLLMLTGVVPATQHALRRAHMSIEEIDAYEVNEAFAPVPLAWARALAADPEKLNPRGGAIALGHPLGSSGTRLLTTLLHHLEDTGGRFGLQTMCEFGGMANATIIETLQRS